MLSEVSFYRVTTDVDQFQYLLTDQLEDYCFDGRQHRNNWRAPDVYSYKPRRPEPDFWDFGMGAYGTAWAIRPEAFQRAPALNALLRYSGELLPLTFDSRDFVLFNVTECIDALDRTQSVWRFYEDGSLADVQDPVFRLDRLGASLFKIPEDGGIRIYYWEEEADWQSQLRAMIERDGLTGLEFTPLYSTRP